MKKVLATLLTTYVLTSGQPSTTGGTASTTAAGTTATAAATTATAPATTATTAPVSTAPAPPIAPPASTTTTAAPPPNNPYCPMTAGQFTGGIGGGNQACTTNVGPGSIVNDIGGQLQCENYGCCLCSEINCGLGATPCDTAYFGDSGAVGAQNINIVGSLIPTLGPFGQQNIGADIDCNGLEACKASKIMGKNIDHLKCSGDLGCAQANIIIDDPVPGMQVQCDGFMGCAQSYIEINIGSPPPPGQTCTGINQPRVIELGQMQFNGQDAASGAIVTVNNRGCDLVMIDNLDCPDPDSCVGTQFIFNGNVQIQQCDLYGATVLPQGCLSGNNNQFNLGLPPQFPPAAAPPVPPVAAPPAAPVSTLPAAPQSTPNANVPAVPGANPPNTPQTTVAALPVPPAVPATSAGTNPASPAPPAAVPAPPAQPVTTAPAAINIGNFPLVCQDLFTCANKRLQVVNPPRNWELDCVYTGVCGGLTLDLNFGPGYFTDQIDGFSFREPNAAQGTTVNINAAFPLEISNFHCEKYGACNGLTINLGPGVDILNNGIDCAEPGACFGCTVNQGAMSAPCEAFNNNGPGMGNFGQPQPAPLPIGQAPFTPIGGGQTPQQQVQQQQPQQPVVPQLPQPQQGVPQYQPPQFPQQQPPPQQPQYPWLI